MLFIFEMHGGGYFEAETKKDIIAQVVKYYGENGEFCAIKSFYLIKNGEEKKICDKVVAKIQHEIDRKVLHERDLNEEERASAERNYFSWRLA